MHMEKKPTNQNTGYRISDEVIIKIAQLAASEIPGVAPWEKVVKEIPEFASDIANRILSPVRVKTLGDAVQIDININVVAGNKAAQVAHAVQNKVKSAVQSMTGLIVSKVNVKIDGILVPKTQK
jgi:uncharacterized alkaline shock family protein YloU